MVGSAEIARAQTSTLAGPSKKQLDEIVEKGLNYLSSEGQAEDGTFSKRVGPGVTSLAITAALRHGRSLEDPMVKKGLAALETYIKPDGGIYGNGRLKNYETCVAMICFAEANTKGQYDEVLKRARAFVTELQYGTGQNADPNDPWYGGVGYGGSGRPDLSNTAFLIEALVAADAGADDEAVRRALIFVSRCQNLDSPANKTAFSKLVKDGGFYYELPREKVDPSTSPERYTENGGLRSYGSMTYAGMKSMIYAGLTPDDPRVKAAVAWLKDNYRLDQNPGQGTAGLFYYYHTLASSLETARIAEISDAEGDAHAWQQELIAELAKRQAADGSWANENQQWFENDKNLATSFALMALAYCGRPIAENGEGSNSEDAKDQ